MTLCENIIAGEISVVIPTYNRAANASESIESVLRQSCKPHEIIVVDDGSTDDTREKLKSFGNSIRYVYQENSGPGAARNNGVSRASGEWLAFLDSDDTWHPQKLESQRRMMVEMGAEISFHDIAHKGMSGEGGINSWNEYVARTSSSRDPVPTGMIEDPYEMVVFNAHFFLTSTLMMKKNIYDEIGGMEPQLRTNQDIDLYFRLAARYPIAYINSVMTDYNPGNNRAFEVANKKLGDIGKERVYADRVRALKRSYDDRKSENDKKNMKIAKKGITQGLRTLGGERD